MFSIRSMIDYVQYLICNWLWLVFDLWFIMFSIRSMIDYVQYLICDLLCLVFGLWGSKLLDICWEYLSNRLLFRRQIYQVGAFYNIFCEETNKCKFSFWYYYFCQKTNKQSNNKFKNRTIHNTRIKILTFFTTIKRK